MQGIWRQYRAANERTEVGKAQMPFNKLQVIVHSVACFSRMRNVAGASKNYRWRWCLPMFEHIRT
jgi:hypothetical protein